MSSNSNHKRLNKQDLHYNTCLGLFVSVTALCECVFDSIYVPRFVFFFSFCSEGVWGVCWKGWKG